MRGGDVIGWKLGREQRDELLRRFPPRYADVIADHVTLRARVDRSTPPPVEARIVGHCDDGSSLEAMVVAIDGATDRPDRSQHRSTWESAGGIFVHHQRAAQSLDELKSIFPSIGQGGAPARLAAKREATGP